MKPTLFTKPYHLTIVFLIGHCAALPTAHALEPDEIFRRVQESVMLVKSYDAKDAVINTGSAVLIAPENLLTSCHVLAKAKRIEIKQDNVTYGAELVHIDLERDLCQLRAKNYKAKPVDIGNSDKVQVGKKVYALGNPRGLELTLTDGLVSALRKNDEGTLRYIQTSAPVSPGSSGGGLFDSDGKLIGITTLSRVDSQNLNFATPINMYRELAERSKAAMAKAAEKTAEKAATDAKLVTTASKTSEKPEEKPLLGQDLRDHFSQQRRVNADAEGAGGKFKVILKTNPVGSFSMTNTTSTINGISFGLNTFQSNGVASWKVKAADQVCLNFRSIDFSKFHGCYRLFMTESKKYIWRSTEDSTTIQYTDE